MGTGESRCDVLDTLLERSDAWLADIQQGRFEGLETAVAENHRRLAACIGNRPVSSMEREQQEKLRRLLLNYGTASARLLDRKEALAADLGKIRKGRILGSTYHNSA